MKLSLCLIFGFSLWYFASLVFGSSESELELNQSQTSNPNLAVNSELSLVLQRLEAQEERIRELEKSGEDCKKSHKELKVEVKTLRKEVDDLKNENSGNEDVWLLTPPLRGRRGQKGEKGDSGLNPAQQTPAQKGEKKDPVGPQLSKGDQSQGISTVAPQSKSITTCSDAMEIVPSPRSAQQTIYPHGNGNRTSLEVLCDFETDGGGWTVIQKRSSGPAQEFNRNWTDYAQGFGLRAGNFWLGLDNIHALTKDGDQELRIDLEDFDGNKRYAKYSNFSVSDASDFYRLSISGFSENSTAGDSMTRGGSSSGFNVDGSRFSTFDQDNDENPYGNCVDERGGGWWFSWCSLSGLNGQYFEKEETVPLYNGIFWHSWKGDRYSLAKSEMKIRKRK